MSKLRWKKCPKEKGLARIGAGSLVASELHDGTKVYAMVCPVGGNWRSPFVGWYWYSIGLPNNQNTCKSPTTDEEEAKEAAKLWVEKELKKGDRDDAEAGV